MRGIEDQGHRFERKLALRLQLNQRGITMIYVTLAYLVSQINFWDAEAKSHSEMPSAPMLHITHHLSPGLIELEDKQMLAYELEIVNMSQNIIDITELLIVDSSSNQLVKHYDKQTLKTSATSLDAGVISSIYILLSFPKDSQIPQKLRHRIRATSQGREILFKGPVIEGI